MSDIRVAAILTGCLGGCCGGGGGGGGLGGAAASEGGSPRPCASALAIESRTPRMNWVRWTAGEGGVGGEVEGAGILTAPAAWEPGHSVRQGITETSSPNRLYIKTWAWRQTGGSQRPLHLQAVYQNPDTASRRGIIETSSPPGCISKPGRGVRQGAHRHPHRTGTV